MNRQAVSLDADCAAQAIDCESLDEIVRSIRLAVEQQVFALAPDDEVEQAFALRRQQSRPDRKLARNVARDDPLQEAAHVLAREPDDGAVHEGGGGHAHQLGSGAWHRKS